MKSSLTHFSLFLCTALLAIINLSWLPVSRYEGTVFAKFLEAENTVMDSKFTNAVSIRNFLNIKKKKQLTTGFIGA